MSKQTATTALTLASFAILGTCAVLAQDPNTGRKVGEKLDNAAQDIRSGLRKAGGAIKDQYAAAKASVHNMGVESRVYSRLHWDKDLEDATLDLAMESEGVVTLNGSVASEKAKAHAVEVASRTVGVTKVIDRLAVRPAASATSATNR